MQVKQLFRNDDAVSPVIGVILMVAITVILAAVIATFVLGLGEQVSSQAPQASFSFEWEGSSGTDDPLEITHSGGETLDASNVYIRGDAGTDGGNDNDLATMGQAWYQYGNASQGQTQDLSAGNTLKIGDIGSDAEVDVIWQKSTGENSATLGDWEGPDA